jgi:hypothetical protein
VLYSHTTQIRDSFEVELDSIDSILDGEKVAKLDFVSIDVEGYEEEALSGFNLKKWEPALIFIEDHLYQHRVHFLLKSRGYKLVRRTDLNMWYVPNKSNFPVSLYGRWQLFRKLYVSHPFRMLRLAVKRFTRPLKNQG